MAGNTSTPGASVISRAMAVLNAFDEDNRRLTLTEIARRSDLPLPTTHRLSAELVAHGALHRTTDGRYEIGEDVWRLGLLAPIQTGLREVASPFLHDVYGATLATVHLAARDGVKALYLARLSGNASVPVVSTVGARLPLHCTAVGKVLLAFAPDSVRARVMSDLTRVTPYTIVEPGRLATQLSRVRADGFATTVEEMSLGACSVAVPVLDSSGNEEPTVVAAIGVVVPSLKRDRPRLVSALRVAAHGISRSLHP